MKLYFTSYDKIKEGKSYRIHAPRLEDSFTAGNSFYNYPNISFDCGTNSKYGGVIKIVKFDLENRILAATFSYDAVEKNGTIHTIRNGWFDLKF